MFLVTSSPGKGKILYLTDAGRYEDTQNFTQSLISQGRIFYKHDQPFKHIKDFDFFNFEAVADYAPYRLKSVFNVVISVTAQNPGGIERYIKVQQVVCPEGGNVTIFPQNLNTTGILHFLRSGPKFNLPNFMPLVKIKLSSTPLRGTISIGGGLAKQGAIFTQGDLDTGRIIYSHDDSDTVSDRVGFSVYLVLDLSQDILVYQSQLNISITPVNDRMPFLVTKNPSIVVVRGQSKPINRDMLEIQDPDTEPQDIHFTILDNGLQGRLVFKENQAQSISHFSQDDINKERVLYVHDGASSQTQFYFSVTDGRFQPRETGLSRHFRIHIIPLSLDLQNQTVIQLDQVGLYYMKVFYTNISYIKFYTNISYIKFVIILIHL